jgi:hypothetical protein
MRHSRWLLGLRFALRLVEITQGVSEKAGDLIDSSICQQPFYGLPIWLGWIIDPVTPPAELHFVTLC